MAVEVAVPSKTVPEGLADACLLQSCLGEQDRPCPARDPSEQIPMTAGAAHFLRNGSNSTSGCNTTLTVLLLVSPLSSLSSPGSPLPLLAFHHPSDVDREQARHAFWVHGHAGRQHGSLIGTMKLCQSELAISVEPCET